MGIHHLRPPNQDERQHALFEVGPMEVPRGEHIRCTQAGDIDGFGIIIRQGDVSIPVFLVGRALRLDVVATGPEGTIDEGHLPPLAVVHLAPTRQNRTVPRGPLNSFLLGVILGQQRRRRPHQDPDHQEPRTHHGSFTGRPARREAAADLPRPGSTTQCVRHRRFGPSCRENGRRTGCADGRAWFASAG